MGSRGKRGEIPLGTLFDADPIKTHHAIRLHVDRTGLETPNAAGLL
jgi:hypothetical protein